MVGFLGNFVCGYIKTNYIFMEFIYKTYSSPFFFYSNIMYIGKSDLKMGEWEAVWTINFNELKGEPETKDTKISFNLHNTVWCVCSSIYLQGHLQKELNPDLKSLLLNDQKDNFSTFWWLNIAISIENKGNILHFQAFFSFYVSFRKNIWIFCCCCLIKHF